MRVTKRFKELYVDVFVKIFQIVFAVLVIGPIVSGKFNPLVFILGIIASLLCLFVSSKVALTIFEKEE